MKFMKPSVFQIGQTSLNTSGMRGFLQHIGARDWCEDNFKMEGSELLSRDSSDLEKICEVYSRGCYKSFGAGLNPNITKIREGNELHLSNVIKSAHGSVFEHAMINFALCDVSRVLTHELCRHRVGIAISQESLRYVRLTELKCMQFEDLDEISPEDNEWFRSQMSEIFTFLEDKQKQFTVRFNLDNEESFAKKKKLTSRMRRAAPLGLLTYIGWSANIRTLRHLIPLRTHKSAEEEIRFVYKLIGQMMIEQYPHAFFDFHFEKDGSSTELGEWRCENVKI